MQILITGGTGFVGNHLADSLAASGHDLIILTRTVRTPENPTSNIAFLVGDPRNPGDWQEAVSCVDCVINLAGASIFTRWNEKTKQQIIESRVATTRNLVEAMKPGLGPAVFLSASAVGFYGFNPTDVLDESWPGGDDFLARTCQAWEAEANKAQDKGIRTIIVRLGLTLNSAGGVLGKMIPIFKAGLGGRLGNGKQWFSWIHSYDLTAAIQFLIKNQNLSGAFNLTSPNPVTNLELTKALSKILKRPALARVPGFALKLAMGEFASVILNGQKVIPKRLQENGFGFKFPALDLALEDQLAASRPISDR